MSQSFIYKCAANPIILDMQKAAFLPQSKTLLIADFTWILGNHDPDIPTSLKGHQHDHLEIDGFLLTHLPTPPEPGKTNLCGHLHPKKKVTVRRRNISHPCFACSDSRIILPSFGAYTGGLFADHHAIQSELGEDKLYALTTPTGIYPVK